MKVILTPLPTLMDPSLCPEDTTSDANTEAGGRTKGCEVGLEREQLRDATPHSPHPEEPRSAFSLGSFLRMRGWCSGVCVGLLF